MAVLTRIFQSLSSLRSGCLHKTMKYAGYSKPAPHRTNRQVIIQYVANRAAGIRYAKQPRGNIRAELKDACHNLRLIQPDRFCERAAMG